MHLQILPSLTDFERDDRWGAHFRTIQDVSDQSQDL